MAGLVTRACRLTPRLLRNRNNVRLVSLPGGPGVNIFSEQPSVRAIAHVSKVEKKIQQIERDSEAVTTTYFRKLEQGIQQQRRIMEYELQSLLGLVEKAGHCSPSQAMLMIKCCGDVMVDIDSVQREQHLDSVLNTLDKVGVKLDVSLYNTILKVHLENRTKVNVEEILSELKSRGEKPNRVTFQLCHDLLCVQGDTEAASLLVTQLGLAMSDSMLAARLGAHIANKEAEAATSLLADREVLSSELVQSLASAHGRLGHWDKVEDILAKAKSDKVKISNEDLLRVMTACSQGGLHAEAASLMSKLNSGYGYASHIRSFLPEVARTGNVGLAVQMYLSVEQKKNRNTKTPKDTDGLYLARSLMTSGADTGAIVEAVVMLDKELEQSNLLEIIILEAAKNLSQHCVRCDQHNYKRQTSYSDNIQPTATDSTI